MSGISASILIGEQWAFWKDENRNLHQARVTDLSVVPDVYVHVDLGLIAGNVMTRGINSGNYEFPCAFGIATYLAGVNPMRLRAWLDRKLIGMDADDKRPSTSKHRRFSWPDVFNIAVVARLIDSGFTVKLASILVVNMLNDISKHTHPMKARNNMFIRFTEQHGAKLIRKRTSVA